MNKNTTVNVYDNYYANSAWATYSGTKDEVIKAIQNDFRDMTEDEINYMIIDCAHSGRIDMTDFGDCGDDFWVEVLIDA